MHACIDLWEMKHMHACIDLWEMKHMHACMGACVCIHVCMNVCIHVCMNVCIHVCMNVCIHVTGSDHANGCGPDMPMDVCIDTHGTRRDLASNKESHVFLRCRFRQRKRYASKGGCSHERGVHGDDASEPRNIRMEHAQIICDRGRCRCRCRRGQRQLS
jgi:hypothetical protein